MLEIRGLNASYGGVQVLWEISLKIERGIVSLIGAERRWQAHDSLERHEHSETLQREDITDLPTTG